MSIPTPTLTIPKPWPKRGFEGSGEAKLRPRYEDIAQDGRVQLHSLMTGLGAVWRTLAESAQLRSFQERGILPILSRIVMLGEEGPFSVSVPIHIEGTWRLARETNGERLFLDMWLDAYAPHAHTQGGPPAPDAERALVGRIYAEHVITRPFASTPAERKVTRLDVPGFPALPEDEHPHLDAPSLVAGQTLELAREQVFGMLHTDSNQHVNSLVYPRLFEETVATRAMAQKLTPKPHLLLMTGVELRYRKPFFAGDHALITMGLTPAPAALSAIGAFHPAPPTADGDLGKPSTTLAMTFQ